MIGDAELRKTEEMRRKIIEFDKNAKQFHPLFS